MKESNYIFEQIEDGIKISDPEEKIFIKIYNDGKWYFSSPKNLNLDSVHGDNIFRFLSNAILYCPKENEQLKTVSCTM